MSEAARNVPLTAEEGRVYVEVSGLTGTGKSAVMGEIEIALKALGLQVEYGPDFQAEKNGTHADWQVALDLYKPTVVLVERNVPHTPAPAGEGDSVVDWFFRSGMGFDGPHPRDTPLQAAAREAGWALMQNVDHFPFERRQQVSDICARLACSVDASPPSNGDVEGAVERLTRLATDCDYAAMPTKPDVVTLCGWTAGETRDDLRTLLSALSAHQEREARAREALERADQFITNGVDLGFIRMPDADTPDPALETPGIIRAALQSLKETK